ncbi:MAG: beta-galactosidase GalB [Bacteroidota bacterium]
MHFDEILQHFGRKPGFVLILVTAVIFSQCNTPQSGEKPREKISINEGWQFFKYESRAEADNLIYDQRPEVGEVEDARLADAEPTEAEKLRASQEVLKPWILPTANDYIKNPEDRHERPEGNPGQDFAFVQHGFDDRKWQTVNLPHDWAISGPFLEGWEAEVGGGMGRLPSPGVAWYRKKLDIPSSDEGKSIFLDVDGAMSYAMVWLNGNLVGGWPYGYNSWRVDLTPYVVPGGDNQLAIRLDNPNHSSRWYPGGGLYRNVWLVKTNPVHIAHWGTYITTPEVSESSATINMELTIDNDGGSDAAIEAVTNIYALDENGNRLDETVASFDPVEVTVPAGDQGQVKGSASLDNPRLWGPFPTQTPNMYVAVTDLSQDGKLVDSYETKFGIRSLRFDADSGLFVNGEHIYLKGTNQHHDLGALGAAFNVRAAERQLEILREMGCNAIRMAHNPPAPELLELTDRMGFLVVNEIFDVWARKKTPLDFHLIFPEWHEPDLRNFIRRDRNYPSVIVWSLGNEVGEQYTGEDGAALAQQIHDIAHDEDPTRPTTISMNFAKPPMPITGVMDLINLNYQGEGIRNAPAYSHLQGINTPPLYRRFHEAYPEKLIISSENAAAVSSRGEFLFPVFDGISAPVEDGQGGNPETQHVSAYELYTAPFGSSADKVFRSLDQHPYVGGGFVWSGWDYLGEPTPYYSARSSYFGVIDLAGFKKSRFYLYQANWRPDLPMAHIIPHWNWPDREGEVTPVHVFTTGDEAELFLNGESLGRKTKDEFEYRLRWDDVVYEPGELKVVAHKNGEEWAEQVVKTTGEPAGLEAVADRDFIMADGKDLAFITVKVTDSEGLTVPDSDAAISFTVKGAGEIVATDNGDPTNMTAFSSHEREAFNGRALVIVRSIKDETGAITVTARSEGLEETQVIIKKEQ